MEISTKITGIEVTIKMSPGELEAVRSWRNLLIKSDDGVSCISGEMMGLYSFLNQFLIEIQEGARE